MCTSGGKEQTIEDRVSRGLARRGDGGVIYLRSIPHVVIEALLVRQAHGVRNLPWLVEY